MFAKPETYMYTTKHYKAEYEYYKNKNIKKTNHFQNLLNTYPNITKTYNGLNTTLLDKIQDNFYNLYKDKTETISSEIEKYSLDKRLKRTNFTTNFRHFLV